MANVYTIKVTLDEFEDTFWREIQVSSNNTVAKLAYVVLASFEAKARHLFNLQYAGIRYELTNLPFAEITANAVDAATKKLKDLKLEVGSCISMEYDFGAGWGFHITVETIEPMIRGQQNRLPLIVDGGGDLPITDDGPSILADIIAATDAGNIPVFYDEYTGEEFEIDYREYDPDFSNEVFKLDVDLLEMGYEYPDEMAELFSINSDEDDDF